MNNRLRNALILQDAFHGFRKGEATGTDIIEAYLTPQLAGIVHKPLFQVFIDVRQAYNFLDREICMKILRKYGLGTKLQRLMHRYWDKQKVYQKPGSSSGDHYTRREE